MGLDIRLPIGLLFTLLGVVLVVVGIFSDASIYGRSLGHNVNLYWGVVLVVFGTIMWYYGRRGMSTVRLASDSPEGRATEAREHDLGLESERPRPH